MCNKPEFFRWYFIFALIPLGLLPIICTSGCGTSSSATPASKPDVSNPSRTIPYPADLELDGAAAYERCNDHPDSRYFVTDNDWFEQESTSTLTIISQFATYQQTTESTCGPATILMTLHHYGITTETEASIAQAVGTDPSTGTSVEAVRDYFMSRGWQVESHVSTAAYFADVDDFYEFARMHLQAGHPILVDWTRWDGHWTAIIGLDTMGTPYTSDDMLIMADPYDTSDNQQDGYFAINAELFFYEWHEGDCTGKIEPYQQSFIVAYP